MATAVTGLKKNQCAVFLGEKVFTNNPPLLSVRRVGDDGSYQLIITLDITVADENIDADTKALAPGSFAVLDIADDQLMTPSSTELFFQAVNNGAADDFLLRMDFRSDPPGGKGNHGN